MKKTFFNVIAALALVCGVFAFSGCADYETDINNLNDRVDALETGRIADVEDQLASLQEALASAESAIDAIEALNLEELSQDLSDLKATVQEIENGLSDYATRDYVDATFATKTDVADLNTKLGKLEGDLKSLEGKYDSDLKISEIIKKIDQAQDDASEALGKVKSLMDALGVYAQAGQLQAALDSKLDIADFDAKFEEALQAALDQGGMIDQAIAKAINEVVEEFNDLFAQRLTSVSLIPELYVDGTPTIPFYTIVYEAKEINTEEYDETFNVIANVDLRNVSLKNTVARYHTSPDGLTKSDIGTPEYLIEEVFDLKSSENPFFSIASYDFVDGEFHVELKKNTTDGYVMHDPTSYVVHTAALKIPIAEKNLVEGEQSAAVYSEYSKIAEVATDLHIASRYDLNRYQESGEYECNIRDNHGDIVGENHLHFYDSFKEATEARLPAKRVHYGEKLDLYDMVTGCLLYGFNYEDPNDEYENYWSKEITREELEALGFEFRFSVPKVKYLLGDEKTNQQEFGQIVDGHYLQSLVPGGATDNRAAIGRMPVVRAEIIDTNNDNAIVCVAYFRIVWVETEIPSTVIEEPLRTFEYILSCEPFQGRLTWDEINALLLSKIGEDGISHNMFVDAYEGGEITLAPADGRPADFYTNAGDVPDVFIDWDVNPNAPATSVFVWNLDIERIGNVIDDLLADKEVKFAVTVTVHPNAGAETYAGTQTFTVEMVVKLPLLPAIEGVNEMNWTVPGELIRIDPVLYNQHNDKISETVYFRSIFNLFFAVGEKNIDGNYLFVNNIVPTQAQVDAAAKEAKANGKARDLKAEWACRGWDVVFDHEQPGTFGYYGPDYFVNDLHWLTDRASYGKAALIAPVAVSPIDPWQRTNDDMVIALNSYTDPVAEAKWLLNRNRTKTLAANHYRNGITANNDKITYGEDFKYVTFEVISRINPYNIYSVQSYDAWFVNPLSLDVTISGSFKDQVIGGSKVSLANVFSQTKDFNNESVAVKPGSTGRSEELRQYYDVQAPVWYPQEALISLVKQGGDLVVNNSLNANIESERAQMQKISDLKSYNVDVRLEWDEANDELVFYADNGWVVEQSVKIWVKVTVKHKWGEETRWAPITLNPAASTGN